MARCQVALALFACALLLECGALPSEGVVKLVDEDAGNAAEADAAEMTQEEEMTLKTTSKLPSLSKASSPVEQPHLTFAGTMERVVSRFCTERLPGKEMGDVFCNELIALQSGWVNAEAKGTMGGFTKLMGMMQGHYCPQKTSAEEDAKCMVVTLLREGIPINLKWNSERKRYLQLTKDVGKHFCKLHGENALFCPLMKALRMHFFHAVTRQDSSSFKTYLTKLNAHYCTEGKDTRHPADERCSMFPLLLHALPEMTPDDDKMVLEK